jgi:hypothetical protein
MPSIQDQITQLWGEITAATHRFLELIGELDRTDTWMGIGMVSCAQWLNLHRGIGEVAAREKLRVAHAIRELPAINAAFRDGRVSYSKVRAMTRVATPENESVLLNIALHGTAAHVERTVRHFRLPADIGELVIRAIERAAELANEGSESGDPTPSCCRIRPLPSLKRNRSTKPAARSRTGQRSQSRRHAGSPAMAA